MKSHSFFDTYASEYDWLTNAAARTPAHDNEIALLVERFRPTRVLDAGCATGLTASLFASRGIETVGLDRSRQMLAVAKQNYESRALPLIFKRGSFETLPINMANSFDLIVCLANSIVGVETTANLRRSLLGFMRVLRPGGALVQQSLNVKSLRDGQVMPIRTTDHNGVIYSRFLERSGSDSILYITRIDTHSKPVRAELFRHSSASFTAEVLNSALIRAGFVGLHMYADLMMTKRFTAKARDIVIVAHKPR